MKTMRLTLSYEGSSIRLIGRQRIKMVSPPSDDVDVAEQKKTGFWYEVRSSKGEVLFRRVTENPIRLATEIRSDDPARPLVRQEVKEAKGTFILIVPDLPGARTLVLFSSPLEIRARPEPAREIARFDLRSAR